MPNKKLFAPVIKVIILTVFLVSILSFVYVLAQEQATITNSGTLTTKENGLNYKFDWGETTITLYKEDNVFANNYIQNKENGKGWKFGASDTSLSSSETAEYKYVLESTKKLVLLEKQRFNEKENLTYNYPVVYNYHANPEDEWNEFRHVYDFEDVCSKNYSQCKWLFNGNSLELTFISDWNIDPEIENVSSCRTLDAANQYYQLNKSLTTSGDCIIISSNNITLDLNGYGINSSTIGGIENYGITFLKANSSTIKNGALNNFYVGICINDGDDNNVTNLTIKAVGDFLDFNSITGILVKGDDNFISGNVLSDFDLVATEGSSFSFNAIKTIQDADGVSNNTVIQNNIINNNKNYGTGSSNGETFLIDIQGSTNSFILNNILSSNTGSNILYGIYSTSNSTIAHDNTISDCGGNTFSYGIYLYDSHNDYITAGSIDSFDYGVYLTSSKNNFFSDLDFIYPEVSVSLSTNSTNNTFLNVSNQDNENVEAGLELICKWYYRAYVNDTLGLNVSGANVTAFNVSNAYQFNLTTDSTGFTQLGEIIDYVNNGGTRTYYSLYNIYASNSSYSTSNHSYNTTLQQSNYKDVFTLTGISTCGSLTQANTVYTLQNDLSATGTCLTVGANNITIDLNGYNIAGNYSLGDEISYGIYGNGYNKTTIKNGSIYNFYYGIYFENNKNNNITNITANSNWYGIVLSSSLNNTLTNNIANSNDVEGILLVLSSNNTLTNNIASLNYNNGIYLGSSSGNILKSNTVTDSSSGGIYLSSSSNNILTDNIIHHFEYGIILIFSSSNNQLINNTANSNTYGIYIGSSSGNYLENNTADSNSQYGIYLSLGDNHTLVNNNVWNCSSAGSYACIGVVNSNYNVFDGNRINKSSNYGIKIYSYYSGEHSSHNIFKNTNMTNIEGTSVVLETVYGYGGYSYNLNNTFLNFSYNNEILDANSELIRKWYYRAYVNDTSGNNVSGANVTAYNATGNYNFNLTTDSTGYTQLGEIIDYINNGGTKTYYSNYTINASKPGYYTQSRSLNVTENKNTFMVFTLIRVPVFGVLHSIHTTISDNPNMNPSQRVSNLKKYYDWASTVDHDTQINPSEWTDTKNEANGNNTDNKFTYFIGYEWKGISVGNAEVTAFFMDNGPLNKVNGSDPNYDTFIEFAKWLSDNKGLGQHNHPARTSSGTDFSNPTNVNETWIPLVEMVNQQGGTSNTTQTYYWHWNYWWNCSTGSGCTTYPNPKGSGLQGVGGTGWVKYALDKGYHLGFIGGSDYHGTYEFTPRVYTGLVNPPNFTRSGIFETLKKRHTWVAEDKIFMSITAYNGSDILVMGDIFNTTIQNFYINYSINGTTGTNTVNVSFFFDGIIRNLTKFSGQQNVIGYFNYTLPDNKEHYMFVEATQSNGRRAWSSPMYVTYSP